MNLLALDLSTHASGYAVFANGTISTSGVVIQNEKDLLKRVTEMTNHIVSLAKVYEIDKVIAEEVLTSTFKGNIQTTKALLYLQGAVAIALKRDLNLDMEFIYPNSWRAVCGIQTGRGIKREELKKKDIEFAEKTYGIKCKTDDEADALGILYFYLHKDDSAF